MSRLYKFLFAILILILFAEILIFAPRAIEEPEPLSEAARAEDNNDQGRIIAEQTMGGVHLVETHEGGRDWELFSAHARGYENEGYWELEEVKVVFYSAPGVTFTVVGKTGRFEIATKNMDIQGDVVVTSSNGYRFETDRVIYDGVLRTLDSPSQVKIQAPADASGNRMYIQGGNMLANITTSNVRIGGRVHARKKLDKERTLAIQSNVVELSGRSYKADFIGKVKINLNTTTAYGPRAQFHIDPESKMVLSVKMDGGVKIDEVGKSATSKALFMNLPEDKIELTGFPRLFQGSDEIVGDVIVFLNGGKRVKVEDARARVREESIGDVP